MSRTRTQQYEGTQAGMQDEYGVLDTSGETHVEPSLVLESGRVLRDVAVQYKTWGALSDKKDNCVVVIHALTGNADCASWWSAVVGPGKAVDTDRYFVFCANNLGSCYGSSGPASVNPETQKPYGSSWPLCSIRDCVQAQAAALRALGIPEIKCVIGGSMGGMMAVEWPLTVLAPPCRSVASLSASGRHQPWQIGIGECQRQAIFADPNWCDGDFTEPPNKGMQVARMMAMLTYRTHPAYWTKFGRNEARAGEEDKATASPAHKQLRAASSERPQAGPPGQSDLSRFFDVQGYLQAQGRKFLERQFDARSYVALTETMDTHDLARGRGDYHEVLQRIRVPVLVVSISSDVLYPYEEQLELARHIPDAQHHMIHSDEGHDGFLLETKQVATLLRGFLADTA